MSGFKIDPEVVENKGAALIGTANSTDASRSWGSVDGCGSPGVANAVDEVKRWFGVAITRAVGGIRDMGVAAQDAARLKRAQDAEVARWTGANQGAH